MRGRIVFIVLAALVVAGIAALNWPAITRSEAMDFGLITMNAPLGLILLSLLVIALVAFLVSSAVQESRYLMEHRRTSRALHAQHELAEKAEVSRFTELRSHLDNHLNESRQRESMVATEFEKRLMQSHNELRAQLDRMQQMLSSRLGEIESRVAVARPGEPRVTAPTHDVRHDTVLPAHEVPPRDKIKL